MPQSASSMIDRIGGGLQILFLALLCWAGLTLVSLNSQVAVINTLLETQSAIITDMRSDMRNTYAREDQVEQLERRVEKLESLAE